MTSKHTPIGILFVCTGNICRSPTAEAVFRHQVQQAGLDDRFTVESAGTHGYHIGDAADPRAVATAWARGKIDMSAQRARKVSSDDFARFSHIIAMDRGHYALLKSHPSYAENAMARLSLFLRNFDETVVDGAEPGNADVPDPYYGTQDGFDLVYDMIERGCGRILESLGAGMGIAGAGIEKKTV